MLVRGAKELPVCTTHFLSRTHLFQELHRPVQKPGVACAEREAAGGSTEAQCWSCSHLQNGTAAFDYDCKQRILHLQEQACNSMCISGTPSP